MHRYLQEIGPYKEQDRSPIELAHVALLNLQALVQFKVNSFFPLKNRHSI